MRHPNRALVLGSLVAFLLIVNASVFASAVSQVSAAGNKPKSVSNPYGKTANSPLIYAQNPDFNGAYSSQNDTNGGGNFATAYDNFTLGQSYTITGVQWIGSYFNPNVQGTITNWTLTFYADNAGAPGATLATYTCAGTCNETFLQVDNVGDPTFRYGGNGTAFVATAGTQYWLSVVPDLGFPPQWGWETATGGDGAAYQCFFGSCSAIPHDLSFALFGDAATPEPGSLVLLGTGILGLAGSIRRKLF